MYTQPKADLMLVLVTFPGHLLSRSGADGGVGVRLNAIRFLPLWGLCFPLRSQAAPSDRRPEGPVLRIHRHTLGSIPSLSNAGFLCALPVVFTPLLDFLFFRRRPSRKLALVLVMAVTGIALLTLSDDLRPALGDVLCILCALSNAVYLIITERAVARPEVDAFQLGVYQQLVTGLGMLVLSVFLEGPDLPRTPAVWASVLVLSLFCTGAAFLIQSVALQYTTASHVGVIFCLEPVFNSIFAFFVAHEVLSPRAYAGAALLIQVF
ncbi:MAG: DMT family transporter [Flavonifractor plautii]